MNAIAIAIDGLGAGYLGPYGNTWLETPCLNRLAAESLLFEFAISDCPRMPQACESLWRTAHAAYASNAPPSLLQILAGTAIHTCLVTDDPSVRRRGEQHGFAEIIDTSAAPPDEPCDSVEQTQLAQLFAALVDWLQTAPQPFLAIVHAKGMHGPWDAPPAMRQQFADEDDPPPPDFVAPPQCHLGENFDPDELLGMQHAYAGQVSLMDLCFGILLDHFHASGLAENTLLALTSPRGYPLGEHGWVGEPNDAASGAPPLGELLQVPCILRTPDPQHAGERSLAIIQPPDLCATLYAWLGLAPVPNGSWGQDLLTRARTGSIPGADRALSLVGTNWAFRTPAWFLSIAQDQAPQLYAKPDDRWEANEVSERCQDIVALMRQAAGEFRRAAESGRRELLKPLPEILVEVMGDR